MINSNREWDWIETDWEDSIDVRHIEKKYQETTLIED